MLNKDYRHWQFGPTFNADSSFWSWSLLYHSGHPYWCIQAFIFFEELCDWNSLDTPIAWSCLQHLHLWSFTEDISFLKSTSVYSALGADFSVLMCYINSRFTLLTYFTISVQAYSTTSSWHFLLLTPCTPAVTSSECCVPHIISSYHMDLLWRPHP